MKKFTAGILAVLSIATLSACDKNDITPSGMIGQGGKNIVTRIERDNVLPLQAQKALDKATQVTLYSFDSSAPWNSNRKGVASYKQISKKILKGEQARKAIAEVESAVSKGDRMTSNCVFVPQYGLSAKLGKHTYDYLLSYECNQTIVYDNGDDIAWLNIAGTPDALKALANASPAPVKAKAVKAKAKAKK